MEGFSQQAVTLVSNVTGLDDQTIKSRSRRRHIVRSRQTAIYIARKARGLSYPQLGRQFHLDHSTCIHAVISVEKEAAKNVAFASRLDALMKEANEIMKARTIRRIADLPLRLTTMQVCDLAGYGTTVLNRRIKEGRMPAPIDRGHGYIFDRDDVLRALKLIDKDNQPQAASW